MSDFLRVMNQISTVANEVANIANQIAGRSVPPQGQPPYPMPASMPQDTYQWSPVVYAPVASAPPPAPVTPAPAGGFMQVLSSLFSQIAAFFKRLFTTPTAPAPAAPAPTARVAMQDAREQLFAMMPTGRATVMGFVSVTVSRHPDRLVISAGSFGSAAVIRQGGEYFFQENNKQPVRVQGVSSSLNARGDMRFDITLESGKRVSAEILADGRTLRYDDRTLTLR